MESEVGLNMSFDALEQNTSYSQNNMTPPYVKFHVSASDQRFRDIVNEMEVYWIPIIFILGEYATFTETYR